MNRDDLPAPSEGLVLTHFLTVRDIPRSRSFFPMADIEAVYALFGALETLRAEPATSASTVAP